MALRFFCCIGLIGHWQQMMRLLSCRLATSAGARTCSRHLAAVRMASRVLCSIPPVAHCMEPNNPNRRRHKFRLHTPAGATGWTAFLIHRRPCCRHSRPLSGVCALSRICCPRRTLARHRHCADDSASCVGSSVGSGRCDAAVLQHIQSRLMDMRYDVARPHVAYTTPAPGRRQQRVPPQNLR